METDEKGRARRPLRDAPSSSVITGAKPGAFFSAVACAPGTACTASASRQGASSAPPCPFVGADECVSAPRTLRDDLRARGSRRFFTVSSGPRCEPRPAQAVNDLFGYTGVCFDSASAGPLPAFEAGNSPPLRRSPAGLSDTHIFSY